MIVEAFKDTLELGLEKKGQVVVRTVFCPYFAHVYVFVILLFLLSH